MEPLSLGITVGEFPTHRGFARLRGDLARRQRGFTLIELLVTLVILAVALTMITAGGFTSSARGLRFEAERISALLALAREEAQVGGRAIRFVTDESGYAFWVLRERQWRPVLDDATLRPRTWEQPTRVLVQRPDGRLEVEFGRDAIDPPFVLQFIRAEARVEVSSNGMGRFEVR